MPARLSTVTDLVIRENGEGTELEEGTSGSIILLGEIFPDDRLGSLDIESDLFKSDAFLGVGSSSATDACDGARGGDIGTGKDGSSRIVSGSNTAPGVREGRLEPPGGVGGRDIGLVTA